MQSRYPSARYLLAIVALASWLVAGPAWSSITAVLVAPTSASVLLGQPTSVTAVWTVTRNTTGVPPTGTVTSSQGRFIASVAAASVLLGTVSSLLSQPNVPDLVPATMVESVLVPQDIAQRALKLGVSTLLYQRTFVDSAGGATLMGSVTLNVSSSAASAFGVTRMALSFDNGTPLRLLSRREPLSAQVQIGFTGTGLLQGEWQVAGPPSTSGEPFYRTLSQVRQYFAAGSSQVLKSPTLPTDSVGLYYARFRITDPVPGFEVPVIRYFAGEAESGKGLPPQSLAVIEPAPFTLLTGDTAFAWKAIPGARAYQLELYSTPRSATPDLPELGGGDSMPSAAEVSAALARPRVTGMLVPGKQTRLTLSSATRQHLLPGYRYFWRVQAIDDNGAVIGVSLVRELRVP